MESKVVSVLCVSNLLCISKNAEKLVYLGNLKCCDNDLIRFSLKILNMRSEQIIPASLT